MQLEHDFIWVAGNAFSEMRLLVEGAITLFEDDAGCLCRLARDAGANEANRALNDIGTALYAFKGHVKKLQEAHYKASHEPQEADNENT